MPATVDVGGLIDSNRMGRVQWTVVVLCGLIALLDGFDLQAIGLAAPIIAQTLHIPPQTLGAVFSAALAGLALGAFGLGPVADRYGRKKVLVGATLCFGVFTVMTALATSLNELLAYRFLTGLGLGGAMPSFIALTAEYSPRDQRATMVAIEWAGFPLGGVVGGLLGSQLIPTVGWQALFYIGGLLPVVLVPLLILFLPESLNYMVRTGTAPERVARLLRRMFPGANLPEGARFVLSEGEGKGVPVRELFVPERAFGTAMLWVSFFVAFMLLVTNSAWSPILLKAEGMEVSRSALAMAAFNFGSVFGSSAAGWLITRFGAALVLPLSFVVAAASLIAVGQGAPSPGLVTAAEALFGLSMGCGSSGLIVLAALFYPTQIRSTGVGWSMGMGRFGSFIGPLVVGALVAAKLPITTVFLLIGLACLIPVIPCALTGAGRRARTVQV